MKSELKFKYGICVLGAFLLTLFIYSWYSAIRVGANTFFAGQNVGGLKKVEIGDKVAMTINDFESRPIVIQIKNREDKPVEFSIYPADLGIAYEAEKSADVIFYADKSGNLPRDFLLRLKTFAIRRRVQPIYRVDYQKFASVTSNLLSNYIVSPRNATIVFKHGWEIEGESEGLVLDQSQFIEEVKKRVEGFSSEPIRAQKVTREAQIKSAQASRALEKVRLLAGQRIFLAFGSDSWQLSGRALVDIVKFAPKGVVEGYLSELSILGNPIGIKRYVSKDFVPAELDVSLDEANIGEFVGKVAKSIDQETVDATISFAGERVSQFTPARDGQKLDRELTQLAILEKISIDSPVAGRDITINLPVSVTRAKIASSEINALGIVELIGRSVSYFAGSIPNRIFNLTLGSKRISGKIVPPGETFSFNKTVGEVSDSTGYKQAYVISSGRTVLDDGGGICQVSTTIFRAALNAGLPIISRTAHAYRVGYYEQAGFGAGLDATVWSPAVDLVFKNDTNRHILVQAVVDAYDSKLQVDIYGTGDSRVVKLSTPVLSNLKPAPEARYQDDPSLPNGTTKQVDFAAQGATSVFTRKVYKGGKLVIDDLFKSVYRPWQAVYLVGTGT